MTLRVSFQNMKNSSAVTDHVNELMHELLLITDNKVPINVQLMKSGENYESKISCTYLGKSLISKADHTNLYKALSKSVETIKSQMIKKVEKVRGE